MPESETTPKTHFIRRIIEEDLSSGKCRQTITRFPPEPNGYLHIGHAKSICLNFEMAETFGGHCNLRFDDTNPEKEEAEYAYAIEEDVRWLGYEWKNLCHASDYFDQLHDYAVDLIRHGHAYVDNQDGETIRNTRGTLTEPGIDSPYRNRGIEENLDLFSRMRAGEFPEGSHVLRARIQMDADNINMRDPVLYRIRQQRHHRTGNAWSIYPMYDFTHCLSDALEGITHSLCTLEFEDHRLLYDWILEQLDVPCHPQQIEFSRLSLEYTVVSKRLLQRLVQDGHVDGWDDPRLPTLRGLRRRGYTPESIRSFCHVIGVTKKDSRIAMNVLEDSIREVLNVEAPRLMAVLDPIRVIVTNYPKARSRCWMPQTIPMTLPWVPVRFHSVARSTSSGLISWKIRQRNSSVSRQAGKSACATPISLPARKWRGMPRETSSPCTAPMILKHAGAMRRTGARCAEPCIGSPPNRPCRLIFVCTIACSRFRTRQPNRT